MRLEKKRKKRRIFPSILRINICLILLDNDIANERLKKKKKMEEREGDGAKFVKVETCRAENQRAGEFFAEIREIFFLRN